MTAADFAARDRTSVGLGADQLGSNQLSADQPDLKSGPEVFGPVVDTETRCIHYHQPNDIIAIKFACCREYYPCHRCHDEVAGHAAEQWPAEFAGERAILCGVCKSELPITEYMSVSRCPNCESAFNDRCSAHYPLYFAFGRE